MSDAALDQLLLKAHAEDDKAALVRLYTEAADQSEAGGNVDAACFYLTHALVFALETGASEAKQLNARLVEKGRAHPWQP
ncbi:hypothetical protein Q5Y75_07555 [Ruegeria sp. 2205SS24-7]|uniref:hypothetical protein n=1 Tax=Ruegeria discodermiae TaxID=3064389 RepID=UPI0027410546|nr:hypothetical protein [Ruegeria sp. 2205SS24-7]MDP5217068.1 hypothetical protein [Ruegeria sp. 2205SS24-7]